MLLVLAKSNSPGGNSFQLMLSKRKLESDVRTCLSVMGKLFLGVFPKKSFVKPMDQTMLFWYRSIPGDTAAILFARRMKYSISICSNSRRSENEISRVISFRKAFPIWAMPKGTLTRPVSTTFLKFAKIPGRFPAKITKRDPSRKARVVSNIMLNSRGSKRTRLAGSWRREPGLLS